MGNSLSTVAKQEEEHQALWVVTKEKKVMSLEKREEYHLVFFLAVYAIWILPCRHILDSVAYHNHYFLVLTNLCN